MVDQGATRADASELDRLATSILVAGRVLLEVAAGSLEDAGGDLSAAQYQALVALGALGPSRIADLAGALGVSPSNATRMADRLVRKRLVRRQRQAGDRREVRVILTSAGRQLVDDVTRARQATISRLLSDMTPAERAALDAGLRALSRAAIAAAPGPTDARP